MRSAESVGQHMGGTRWLWKDRDVPKAIYYVVSEQGEAMEVYRPEWSIVAAPVPVAASVLGLFRGFVAFEEFDDAEHVVHALFGFAGAGEFVAGAGVTDVFDGTIELF